MHPVDGLAVYLLQSCLLLAGVGILAGRALRWWRRRRDPWRELARRTPGPGYSLRNVADAEVIGGRITTETVPPKP